MTFTDEQIKEQKEFVKALNYRVERMADELAEEEKCYFDVVAQRNKQRSLLETMESNKAT
jgi:hypothetical protein